MGCVTARIATRQKRHAVGLGTLASLLASRAVSRLVYLATTVLLLPAWGEQRYGFYAAAMATLGWVVAPVVLGPEKAVLKVVPRAPRTGPMVSDALLIAAWALPAPFVAWFVLMLLVDVTGPAVVYAGVAAMLVSLGCVQLVAALHRVAGRPRYDALAFLALAMVQLGLLGVAMAGHLAPAGYLACMTGGHLAVNLVLTLRLPRPSASILRRPRFLGRLGWTAVLLAGTDLYLHGVTAPLFALLAASTYAGQVGVFYILTTLWSTLLTTLLYVFRVYAPMVSVGLVGRAGPAGRDRAARLARRVTVYNAAWLVLAGSVVVLAGLTDLPSETHQLLVWVGLLATRAPAVVGMLWAGYVLENTDATAPRVVGLAATVGLAAAALAGIAAVPAQGAVGLIIAAAVGDLAFALTIALRGPRRVKRRER